MLLERQTTNAAAVRAVLDRVKAENRSSLSAPEAKEVADAYGLPAEPSIVGEQPLAGEPDMPDVAEGEPAEGPEDADNSRWEQQG